MIDQIKAEIERRFKEYELAYNNTPIGNVVAHYLKGEKDATENLLSFIESLEKEPKCKTNPLFEDCLAKVNPDVRKEVCENIDKMLEKEQDVDLEKEMNRLVSLEYNNSPDDEWEMVIARHFYELGLNAKDSTHKIKGWVARDKRGTLNFFRAHPRRITDSRGEEYWIGHVRMKQPNEFFPDLKWEDEPIEVELTISRVSKSE